ncbi:hypothetical protein ACTSKR_11435 [Chitinibacteraceae bacterium HSL-7]
MSHRPTVLSQVIQTLAQDDALPTPFTVRDLTQAHNRLHMTTLPHDTISDATERLVDMGYLTRELPTQRGRATRYREARTTQTQQQE